MPVNSKHIGMKCSACGACMNACPAEAIAMQYNAEGFLYPAIEAKKCADCGTCLKVCPVSGDAFALKTKPPQCFAAHADDDVAMASSSGGIFTLLAEDVLSGGGLVCGAAFDGKWLVRHRLVADKSGLEKLRTSKYVQSDTHLLYQEIRQALESGRALLFSGAPCQAAGLYGFLGRDYEHLLTVDIFCHGVPSPKVWERYLGEIGALDILSVNFRDKLKWTAGNGAPAARFAGWKDFHLTIKTANGLISEHHNENIFMRGFLRNLYLRKSCAQCLFAKTPRTADISLGDFWGCGRRAAKQNKGLSAVLLNTLKGETRFAGIRNKVSYISRVSLKDIVAGNPVLKKPIKAHENRGAFFNDFATIGKNEKISDMIARHLGDKNVAIMNFSSFSTHNYGAVLVGYAMERAIEKLGYVARTVNFIPKAKLLEVSGDNAFSAFRKRFMNLSAICTSAAELAKYVNDNFHRIVIGSDQIIRKEYHCDFIYYLYWASGKKTLLSYAASFGIPELRMGGADKKDAARCIGRFDAFSMREENGAELMKNEFGRECPVVCDPTLLLPADEYERLISGGGTVNLPPEYVACYFLAEKKTALRELAQKYPIIDAYKDDGGHCRAVGDWLNIIKNAKYVLTDSFHGTVFSILYRKQFIAVPRDGAGNDRIRNLMKPLGMDRFVGGQEALREDIFEKRIDYDSIEKALGRMRARGYDYLQSALARPPVEKAPLSMNQYIRFLGLLPMLQISHKNQKIRVRLFGLLPLLKIKKNAVYLFEFLKVANIRSFK